VDEGDERTFVRRCRAERVSPLMGKSMIVLDDDQRLQEYENS
jgi:hypothetical protein